VPQHAVQAASGQLGSRGRGRVILGLMYVIFTYDISKGQKQVYDRKRRGEKIKEAFDSCTLERDELHFKEGNNGNDAHI